LQSRRRATREASSFHERVEGAVSCAAPADFGRRSWTLLAIASKLVLEQELLPLLDPIGLSGMPVSPGRPRPHCRLSKWPTPRASEGSMTISRCHARWHRSDIRGSQTFAIDCIVGGNHQRMVRATLPCPTDPPRPWLKPGRRRRVARRRPGCTNCDVRTAKRASSRNDVDDIKRLLLAA